VKLSSSIGVADFREMSVSVRKIMSRNFPVAQLNVFSISLRNFSSYVDKCYEWSSSELCIEEASTPPTSWYTDGTEFDDSLS
jgi:hypothetical protein